MQNCSCQGLSPMGTSLGHGWRPPPRPPAPDTAAPFRDKSSQKPRKHPPGPEPSSSQLEKPGCRNESILPELTGLCPPQPRTHWAGTSGAGELRAGAGGGCPASLSQCRTPPPATCWPSLWSLGHKLPAGVTSWPCSCGGKLSRGPGTSQALLFPGAKPLRQNVLSQGGRGRQPPAPHPQPWALGRRGLTQGQELVGHLGVPRMNRGLGSAPGTAPEAVAT